LDLCAEKKWRRFRGLDYLAKVVTGIKFKDGGNYSDEHPITVSPGANQREEALLSPLPTLKIQ
ncbi:MAG: hypothetical protein KZQ66_00740, partial [Candidatus Thiodiazotropha sp. (ex Lucinoma aequizonata)]|nr:hypothetical protein [Candidatus Thiodiazotropha sp. (ex Lucinoma aequizonata)]MCU7895696.1 hypothetical protein [Candidatus Thiodiazotropha sp. (ex Lucinoma aequizonata)]MCU7900719.1 hypothetical protein [Candidatus Thiodiazotropha sp. (ex Lucinoma aequizonata)]MCU7913685.1 hypothetical protein [Candidatus Thiodiazotropha sp. (ex Lucinoma aequizonata)]